MIKMIISCRCGPVLCGVWRRARSGGGRTQDPTPTLLLLVKVVFPEIQLIPTSGISSSLNFLCKNLLFCVLSIINIISIINTANIIFVISSFCRACELRDSAASIKPALHCIFCIAYKLSQFLGFFFQKVLHTQMPRHFMATYVQLYLSKSCFSEQKWNCQSKCFASVQQLVVPLTDALILSVGVSVS